jgi:hypothetical protein
VASGSSANKVARLAQKSKGKKVRFQGGTLFPSIMAVVIILGTALIAYSRQSESTATQVPSTTDKWHVAYGFYKCNGFLNDLAGTLDDPATPEFTKYGIQSKDDGIIHWHPTVNAAGSKARLGIFLESYGIKVDSKGITFPDKQNNGESYKTSDLKCKDSSGKEVAAQVQVVVWDQYDKPGTSKKYITDFNNIRIKNDGMAITIAIAAPGAQIEIPKSVATIKDVALAEAGTVVTTTIPGATTTTAG